MARREEFRDNVNKLFGRNWKFEKSKSLNYDLDVKGVGLNGYKHKQSMETE